MDETCHVPADDEAADRLAHAMVARMGGPRQAEWANGANPFARPHPDAPWVDRLLPGRSCANATLAADDIGHEVTQHNFPLPERREGPCMPTALHRIDLLQDSE